MVKKRPRTSKVRWISSLTSKTAFWLIAFGALIFGWSIIDAPIGPGEPVKGMVTGFQLTGHNQRVAVIELPGGSVIRKEHVMVPVGGQVNCLRYVKRYWPNESYECQ